MHIVGAENTTFRIINSMHCIADPTKFRFTHETSFVRQHMNVLNKTPASFYIVRSICQLGSPFLTRKNNCHKKTRNSVLLT